MGLHEFLPWFIRRLSFVSPAIENCAINPHFFLYLFKNYAEVIMGATIKYQQVSTYFRYKFFYWKPIVGINWRNSPKLLCFDLNKCACMTNLFLTGYLPPPSSLLEPLPSPLNPVNVIPPNLILAPSRLLPLCSFPMIFSIFNIWVHTQSTLKKTIRGHFVTMKILNNWNKTNWRFNKQSWPFVWTVTKDNAWISLCTLANWYPPYQELFTNTTEN